MCHWSGDPLNWNNFTPISKVHPSWLVRQKRSHLSASFNPLLEEITKARKSDRDGAVDEEQLVTGEGGPQPTPRLRPDLWHPAVRAKTLDRSRADAFLLRNHRRKTPRALPLLSNCEGYEIQTACRRRNMELCTELQLCRTGFSRRRSSLREKARVQFSKWKAVALCASLPYLPLFLQLTICSNRAKTALHSVALNERRQVINMASYFEWSSQLHNSTL